ncbi:AI-2E family transporter [Mesoterricola silvestris]|uniref:AI-2E family transporter n=1 Tax=Mesoterricola silvestris TaxID=2927979 RepID=A0AA48GIP1_9BACT|nr:AI-2E family transporter [Mesoterricola silvestris]BDU71754.1 AI-2E family transporter [Mesoterricola silvestris]
MSAQGKVRIPLGFVALAGAGLLALWFLRSALAPFFLALVLAYVLEPLVDRLARKLGREWASILVILGAVAVAVLLAWALLPLLWDQVDRLITSLPSLKGRLENRLGPWFQAHPLVLAKLRQGLDGLDPMALVKEVGMAGAGLLGWLLSLITLILVPLILYYLLVEGPRLLQELDDLVPSRHLERAKGIAGEVNNRLGGYIRGQLAVSLVMSLLQGLAFQILGVPNAWLLGLVAGFSNVVPYSPYITALPPALLFAAVNGTSGGGLLLVALVFTLVQKTETVYFTPVWVGRASGLHPLEVLLAILSFGYAFGVVGLIFAVPLMIVLKIATRIALEHYKAHPWFVGGEP